MKSQVVDCSGNLIASFANEEDALLCLPAMARALRITLVIRADLNLEKPFRNPAPRGAYWQDIGGRIDHVKLVAKP